MRYAVTVAMFSFVVLLLLGEAGALIYEDYNTTIIAGTENITTFYNQFKELHPGLMYYDNSTGEYVFNLTGTNLHMALGDKGKLIIDKPIRIENLIEYPSSDTLVPESEAGKYATGGLSIGICYACQDDYGADISNVSVVFTGATVDMYQSGMSISAKYISIEDTVFTGEGKYVQGYGCTNPCQDPNWEGEGGCCKLTYTSTLPIYLREGDNGVHIRNVTLSKNVALNTYEATTVDTVYVLNGSFISLVWWEDYCSGGRETVVNRVISDGGGVLFNNAWGPSCYVEIVNGSWNGSVTLLSSKEGVLVVRDTEIFLPDADALRIEGNVTLINTSIDMPTVTPPSTPENPLKEIDLTNIESHTRLTFNCSDVRCHLFDLEGDAFEVGGEELRILPNGTHTFASGIVEVDKYPNIVLKVEFGSAELGDVEKYETGEEYSFNLSAENSDQTVVVTVKGFKPDEYVTVYYTHDGERKVLGTYKADNSGRVIFTYNRGFSDVVLDVVKLEEAPTVPMPPPPEVTTTQPATVPIVIPPSSEPSIWDFITSIYGILAIALMVIGGAILVLAAKRMR
ncbi:MAG: hypothetical protein ACXQS2_03030 [Methermicoccaceae archaeon]